MIKTSEICNNERRRSDVRESDLHGIDCVEVSDDQLTLTVYFLGKAPRGITQKNVLIEGGRRITNIRVMDVNVHREDDPELDDYMDAVVDKAGDFSTYTLSLVELERYKQGRPVYRRLQGTDPRYAQVDFTFKAACPSNLDCKTGDVCPPESFVDPEINYLAKDFASFRQLILDRLALTIPEWQERHIPDMGITLVEVLANVADYLSNYQDAVATEAYLETAQQRISVRRHVLLINYHIHEGCNARTWVFVDASADVADDTLHSGDISFISGHFDILMMRHTMITRADLQSLPPDAYVMFEPLVDDPTKPLHFYQHHNTILFYTWGNTESCLRSGATSATLQDYDRDYNAEQEYHQAELIEDEAKEDQTDQEPTQQATGSPPAAGGHKDPLPTSQPPLPLRDEASSTTGEGRVLNLHVGDFLLFEEVKGARTGVCDDSDVTHRHVVRLTKIEKARDALYDKNVLELQWAIEDALPFPFCISGIGPAPDCALIENISIARGNILLVDSGQTITDADLGSVPLQTTIAHRDKCEKQTSGVEVIAGPYHPVLKKAPLTYRQPLPLGEPASMLLSQNLRLALPQITLTSIPPNPAALSRNSSQSGSSQDQPGKANAPASPGNNQDVEPRRWSPVYDLLESSGEDYNFVVETDNDGFAHLRFGDNELGRAPEPLEAFKATYRVGNGPSGHVGAEAISHIVLPDNLKLRGVTLQPRNPLPAVGGTSPEPLREIKLFAPLAYRNKLERAITADDYARLAEKHPNVRRAAASLRWTGSGYDVLVAIDPLGTDQADQPLLDDITNYLELYRCIGYDVRLVQAEYVSLDLAMTIYVLPHFLSGHVKAALLKVFGKSILPDGTRGFFHPDNLTFGGGIAVSELIAAAQAVPGVMSVMVDKLERFGQGPNHELQQGVLLIGPMEVAQLDNDPDFPEHGQFALNMRGRR